MRVIVAEPRATFRVDPAARERKKSFGAYYTPAAIAEAMANWAIRTSVDRVLDPAAGEAVFALAAARTLRRSGTLRGQTQIIGLEIDRDAHSRAKAVLTAEQCPCELRLGDFFATRPGDLGSPFEAIIGNPPYIRYHRFRGEVRKRALGAAAAAGVRLNGLANAWAPYLVHATRFLASGGRLALVLPAELLHADYAAPVRNFLLRRFSSISVVTFEEAVFPGAMIDTVILLADPNGPAGLRVLRFPNAVNLDLAALTAPSAAPTGRWSKLRAPAAAATVLTDLEASGALMPFSEVASVDIGCVTGGSEFFVVSRSEARRLDLPAWSLRPVVPKPGILSGAILSDADMGSLADDEKCLLLVVDDPRCEQTASPLARYLNEGRKAGISDRYKCRSRSPWYLVPGVRTPHAFLSYMSHRAPRIVLNQAGVTSTNLVHQIRFGYPNDLSNRAVVALLHSSVCLLSFELEGRSYGGGVLKLETREAERVQLPCLTPRLVRSLAHAFEKVDCLLRRIDPEAAAALIDEQLIHYGVVTPGMVAEIRQGLRQLRERRVRRGRTNAQWR